MSFLAEGIYLPTKSHGWAYLRPIQPDDRDVMERYFQMLSEETRYRRFFAPIKNLSDNQWRYLTEIDQLNHVAWGIVPLDRPDLIGVGVGRFVRLDEEPEVAEIALVIRDEMQSLGYGTLLLAVLYWIARERGLKKLRGNIQPDNDAIREWLKKLGGSPYVNEEQMLVVDIPVSEEIPTTDIYLYDLIRRIELGDTKPPS